MIAMHRRSFLTLLGASAAAWPLAARAQQGERMRRVGVLMSLPESDADGQENAKAFRTRLSQLGWIDGDNVRLDFRWAAGHADRFVTAATELVALKPDVLVAQNTPSLQAFRRETQTIPIVFTAVTDPVGQGFVQSFARPAGNITGFMNYEASLGGKWLGLLKEVAPAVKRVAILFNPTTAPYFNFFVPEMEFAATALGMVAIRMPVQNTLEIDRAIGAFAREPDGGLSNVPDGFLSTHRERITALAEQHRLPSAFGSPNDQWAKSGALLSYGPDGLEPHRGAASYVDRILKGAKPADLPVQAPVKYRLVINLKTAKALGLAVPNALQLLADEVIE
jgi:putative ABC transport system substrate-binding protein